MILPDSEQTRIKAAEIIQHGGVIAFRTDTFYGLGADPLNDSAVARIKELKGREDSKPILVLIADARDVVRFIAHRSVLFDRVAERFWPGPLTLVGQAQPELSDQLTAGSGTIGVRLPNDTDVRSLIRICGGALTATSANLSAQPPARTAIEVESHFVADIDLVIDGGDCVATEPSTVLDLSRPEPHILREGALELNLLQQTLSEFRVSLR